MQQAEQSERRYRCCLEGMLLCTCEGTEFCFDHFRFIIVSWWTLMYKAHHHSKHAAAAAAAAAVGNHGVKCGVG
jgi:hypothetical protein